MWLENMLSLLCFQGTKNSYHINTGMDPTAPLGHEIGKGVYGKLWHFLFPSYRILGFEKWSNY